MAAHRYALSEFIIVDNPELKSGENLRLSTNMMDGHKLDYFVLQLSFFGWSILAAITIIGVIPFGLYVGSTNALFYEQVRQEHLSKQIF